MPVIRTPKGKIKLIERHRSPRGRIFSIGEEHEYFDIIERRECKTCGGTRGKVLYKLYKTRTGLVPTTKAILL
jgi:hypothetical protein